MWSTCVCVCVWCWWGVDFTAVIMQKYSGLTSTGSELMLVIFITPHYNTICQLMSSTFLLQQPQECTNNKLLTSFLFYWCFLSPEWSECLTSGSQRGTHRSGWGAAGERSAGGFFYQGSPWHYKNLETMMMTVFCTNCAYHFPYIFYTQPRHFWGEQLWKHVLNNPHLPSLSLLLSAEREHCPPHCLFGRTEGRCQTTGEERSRCQFSVTGKIKYLLIWSVKIYALIMFINMIIHSTEWLHPPLYGCPGKSPRSGQIPVGKWWEPEHCYRG